MHTRNTYRILIWAIVILLATNISMGLSFWFHKQQDKRAEEKVNEEKIEMPAQQRTRFFREQLNLSTSQIEPFREFNRDYNRRAQQITRNLEQLRVEMVQAMGKQNADKTELKSIAEEIGKLHAELKSVTIEYYLAMKAECDENQQKKLNEIFISMLKSKEDVSLPRRGRGGGYRGNHNNQLE